MARLPKILKWSSSKLGKPGRWFRQIAQPSLLFPSTVHTFSYTQQRSESPHKASEMRARIVRWNLVSHSFNKISKLVLALFSWYPWKSGISLHLDETVGIWGLCPCCSQCEKQSKNEGEEDEVRHGGVVLRLIICYAETSSPFEDMGAL